MKRSITSRGHRALLGLALMVFYSPPPDAHAERFALSTAARRGVPDASTHAARDYTAGRTGPAHAFLQLHLQTARPALEARGVRFVSYIPEDTWIVTLPEGFFDSRHPEIRWAAPLTPRDRTHPELWDGLAPAAAVRRDGRIGLYVRFFDDVTREDAERVLASLDAEVHAYVAPFVAYEVDLPPEALSLLSTEDDVFWIRRRTPPMEPANDGILENARIAALHDPPYGLGGSGVTVGVWENGSPHLHGDFASRTTLVQTSALSNHATHVIGTLAGDGSGSVAAGGTPLQWRGAAHGANVVVYDVSGVTGEYAGAVGTFGVTLTNNSWVLFIDESIENNCDAYGDYDFLAPEFDGLVTTYEDSLVVVFSAGNERDDGDCGLAGPPYVNYSTMAPPGTAKNVLAVGAINSNDDSITGFSSWGPTDDGRIKPDLVAPGCEMGGDTGVTSCKNTTEYGRLCGTSMAAPAVTGALTLVDEAYRARNAERPPGRLLRAVLLNTARDLGQVGPDYRFGFGALDATAAVDLVNQDAFALGEVSTGTQTDHVFHVSPSAERVRVTLTWDDPAAAPQANPAIVNDLDLNLVDPNGVTHDPWVLNPNFPSLDATRGVNQRDVVEEVLVDSPTPGEWIARVTGSFVPLGPETYALAGTTPEVPCAGERREVPAQYATIQAAIDASSACDTVSVAAGTYAELLDIETFVVVLAESGPAATIIEPPFPSRPLSISAPASIEGFTIRGGAALGLGYPGGYGGAVFMNSASATFRDCRFRNNRADRAGGAIYAFGGAPRFVSCDFDSNMAATSGGAVYLESVNGAELTDCVLHHNSAEDGGAVAVVTGSADIYRSTLADNVATDRGGAVHVSGQDTVRVTSTIVARNTAADEGGIACAGTLLASCNDHWANTPADTSCAVGTDEFSRDPLFCERFYGDYAIDLLSPCHPDSTPQACGRVGARDPIDCSLVAVDPSPVTAPPGPTLHVVGPNPLARRARIVLNVPSDTFVDVAIYDAGGRRLLEMLHAHLSAGRRELVWDGRDARGHQVTPGVYFVRATLGGSHASGKLVVIR